MARMEQRLAEMDRLIRKVLQATRQWPPVDMELSKQQIFLLLTLLDKKRATVGELAEQLALSPSATTIAVNRLTQIGYIDRSRDESDRRLVWLQLSEEGERRICRFKDQRNEFLIQMLSCLSDEEADQFFALLEKMTNRIT